ncbi:MAG: sodium-dependent transporter [Bacteroidota bacterium]|nr:sodium-dependent transporter [Bacteroidota bacterium]MDX5447190.1 sodium-dependent transporter [Bacteroidota bacterium]MDX5504728.1 sodium-dependent transporter [Bacteroidota bacterium]
MSTNTDSWGSRVGLILAMAGNAVGLGNFLRFPVQAVQNGGGAFIIPYLVCFLLMGIPLLWMEWGMGRFGGAKGHHSTPFILDTMNKRRIWKYIGVFGIFTNIAVASYYCYIESWTMSYVYHSIIGTFRGMDQAQVADFFVTYTTIGKSTTGIPYEAVVFYILCLLLNTWILSKGLGGVEKVAKIGVPMLLIFGAFLAIRGLTLGESGASAEHPDANAWDGFNFLWTPQFDSLSNPKVWLAAAGQIFFTLSVGMGTVHCYASYLKMKDDVALNAVTSGFTNEFVEVVLGSMIVIPIAAGYLGMDWVRENAGFGMAFQTMPFLFEKWGVILATFAGVFWFGLLFFAGITSSLAMGTPWVGFLQDEFDWKQRSAAWSFGLIILIFGLPTVLFFNYGVFDEYDYWGGTVSLVIFALIEAILFSWIFGIKRGWETVTAGADLKIPIFFKFVMKYITPALLLFVFVGSLITPRIIKVVDIRTNGENHSEVIEFLESSGFEKKRETGNEIRFSLSANQFSQNFASVVAFENQLGSEFGMDDKTLQISDYQNWSGEFNSLISGNGWQMDNSAILAQLMNSGINAKIKAATDPDEIKQLKLTRNYSNLARGLLSTLFLGIAVLVYIAYRRRMKLAQA